MRSTTSLIRRVARTTVLLAACATFVASTFVPSYTRPVAGELAYASVRLNGPDQCAGAPQPYGLIGFTWNRSDVGARIGCATEQERDIPGRHGRVQTFQRGQIAWTPDQGPRMTIWAIKDRNNILVRWNSNDPGWSYDYYLIRWDHDGRNVGQKEISGKTEGWWPFAFNQSGTWTFIVEGHSGGGYHHGWTPPIAVALTPSDIAPPPPPPPPPVPTHGCPPSFPQPYGLIGATWDANVWPRIGCASEPEHDVPGRRGRIQTFEFGQIAWTPDQGSKMTIWTIRDKNKIHVHWDANDPGWTYGVFILRWDKGFNNLGQRDISGTREGWWDFEFNEPGAYSFVVEGCDEHFLAAKTCHHGWTIPVGAIIPESDIAHPPSLPPPPPSHGPSPVSPAPSQQSGVAEVNLFNCVPEHDDNGGYRPLYYWTKDLTTGKMDSSGPVEDLYDDSGYCPPVGSEPYTIHLIDGHVYQIVAVDPQGLACNGRNDPNQVGCIRQAFNFIGKSSGDKVDVRIPS